jgi:hypothetical protein
MNYLLLLGFAASLCSRIFAQPSPCTCAKQFERLQEKITANYIAYHLNKSKIESAYQVHQREYRLLSSKTNLTSCTKLLQAFLDFFHDGHLFVSEFPKLPETELAAGKTWIKSQKIDLNLIKPGQSAIEGYWTDGLSKFVLVENHNPQVLYTHVALVLQAADPEKVGEIKFAVSKNKNNWEGVYYTNAYAPRYVKVTPYKQNSILSIWGGITWGRLAEQNAPIYPPTLPTVKKLDEQTVLLSLPSFLLDKKDFDKVLREHLQVLTSAEYLIIDLRGNTGGNGIYFDLLSLYYEKPIPAQQGFALASADNLEYFKKFASTRQNDPYAPVVASMERDKGIVPGPTFQPLVVKPISSKLKKVAILTDHSNMSAAETFVLFSKATSNKVYTYGENTGGVVDYNNINMVSLGCDTQGIHLGYPTYSLNQEVHLGKGYNQTGIPPDVRVKTERPDILAWVLEHMKK